MKTAVEVCGCSSLVCESTISSLTRIENLQKAINET